MMSVGCDQCPQATSSGLPAVRKNTPPPPGLPGPREANCSWGQLQFIFSISDCMHACVTTLLFQVARAQSTRSAAPAADMQAILALAMVVLLACAASANTAADTSVRRPVAQRRLLATALVDRSLCGPLTPASPGSTLGPGPCISQGRKLTCCGGGQCRIDTSLDAFTNPSVGATARDTANCNAWACCKV
jgi:hypothetical protein